MKPEGLIKSIRQSILDVLRTEVADDGLPPA